MLKMTKKSRKTRRKIQDREARRRVSKGRICHAPNAKSERSCSEQNYQDLPERCEWKELIGDQEQKWYLHEERTKERSRSSSYDREVALQFLNVREKEDEADQEDQGFSCILELPNDHDPVTTDPLHHMHEHLTLHQETKAKAKIQKAKMEVEKVAKARKATRKGSRKTKCRHRRT